MRSLNLIKKIDTHTLTILQEEVRINTHRMLRDPFYYGEAHQDFTYLWLIRAIFPKGKDYNIFREKEYILQNGMSFYVDTVMTHFPILEKTLHDFAKEKKGILARTLLTTLYNDKKFFMHVDTGMYYVFADRYHLVIKSKGSRMATFEGEKIFVSGDIFFINNKVLHSGKTDDTHTQRTHVFFDIIPRSPFVIVYKYIIWLVYYRALDKEYGVSFWQGVKNSMYVWKAMSIDGIF